MPVDDLEYIKWGEGSPHEREESWKSTVRNVLLCSIAKYRDRKTLKTLDIDGEKVPVQYQQYSFSPRDGLFKQTFSIEGKKDPTKLLKSPKKTSEVLVTSDVKKILTTLFKTKNIDINDFRTTIGTWNKFKETDLWKDKDIRDKILARTINELVRIDVKFPNEFKQALSDKSLLKESLVCEGGNAVSDVTRINRANVDATIKDCKDKILPLLKVKEEDTALLGSAGKKDTSGDLDLGIDHVKNVREFLTKAHAEFDKNNIENTPSYGLNEISIRWPISNVDGKQDNKFVQIDIMPA